IGEVIRSAGGAAKNVAESRAAQLSSIETMSLAELKQSIAADMATLDRPVIIAIDDIDRLTFSEIREVFQLVKANADFPNLIYLLMFDREVVSRALDSVSAGRGNEFLEKIVQVLFHV